MATKLISFFFTALGCLLPDIKQNSDFFSPKQPKEVELKSLEHCQSWEIKMPFGLSFYFICFLFLINPIRSTGPNLYLMLQNFSKKFIHPYMFDRNIIK